MAVLDDLSWYFCKKPTCDILESCIAKEQMMTTTQPAGGGSLQIFFSIFKITAEAIDNVFTVRSFSL